MISAKMAKQINEQINREFYSAYLYLAMAADARFKGFKGAAHWFQVQFGEEMAHGQKFVKYLEEQGAKVDLEAIAAPPKSWGNLLEMFRETLEHERTITAAINGLMAAAAAENDFATQGMLQWFIDEQIEEEANDREIVWMLEMSKDSKGALFMADRQLGKRGKAS